MRAEEALIAHLEGQGVGSFGSTLSVGRNVPKPVGDEAIVTVIETGGTKPVGTHNDGRLAYRRPWFQVVARARSPIVARAKAEEAYAALNVTNQTLGGSPGLWFLTVTPMQEPYDLGPDANGMARMAFNVACEHRGVSAS